MNKTEIECLAVFDATMQTLVENWGSNLHPPQNVSKVQLAAAYGGAMCMYLLIKNVLKIHAPQTYSKALPILNDCASQLGLPTTI